MGLDQELSELLAPTENSFHCPEDESKRSDLTLKLDDYKLTKRIGVGGMGSVWLARQSGPIERNVAIKLLKQGLETPDSLRRFETEQLALGLMSHPNVAQVLDARSDQEQSSIFRNGICRRGLNYRLLQPKQTFPKRSIGFVRSSL